MEPKVVIAMYCPQSGKERDLEALVERHLPTLREYGLITDFPPVLLRSEDGTYLEIFEWKNADAMKIAHEHPAIADVWEKMAQVASFSRLEALPESTRRFPHFQKVRTGY